mgnify:CR=1 FL=1
MNHIIEPQEAVEYLKQFAWVKGFDTAFNNMFPIPADLNTIDEEKDDANESL